MKEKTRKGFVGEAAHGKIIIWGSMRIWGRGFGRPTKKKGALEAQGRKRRRCGQLEAHF
jgi:hypothetical protein